MAIKLWNVYGHQIYLRHGWWTGRAEIRVDGNLIFERPSPRLYADFGFAHRFEVDGTPCVVRVVSTFLTFRHERLIGEEADGVTESNHLPIEFPRLQIFLVFVVATLAAIALAG